MENLKILIVDDDEDFRSYVCDLLKVEGIHVLSAADGEGCISILKKEKIDIVITDIVMPNREGIETIMEIKLIFPGVKIIAMSGNAYKYVYLHLAGQLGTDAILAKPFRSKLFMETIEHVCRKIP